MPEPEYVIYLNFGGHHSRMYAPVCLFCPMCYTAFYKYNQKSHTFTLKKRNFLNNKFIVFYPMIDYAIHYLRGENKAYASFWDNQLIDYILASKKELNKHYPNAKFVVFLYDEPYTEFFTERLEKEGVYIVDKSDYKIDPYEDKYRLEDGHPSALFWETVTPSIVKKLNEI